MVALGDNWRESYARRAAYLSAAIDIEDAKAKARSAEKKSADLANAAFRESLKNGAVHLNNVNNDEGENFFDQPVVKGIIDALSIGTYTSAAIANSQVQAARSAKEHGLGGYIAESANQMVNHNPVVMGVKAAFGDDDSKRTYADVIKNTQSLAGIDTESEQSKLVQGIGGFAGDVLLDPTTYLTLGAGAAAKGAIKGAVEGGKRAKGIAKEAIEKGADDPNLVKIAENPKGRISTAISEAKIAHSDWKTARKEHKENRRDIKRRNRNGEEAGVLDPNTAQVGPQVASVEADIAKRNADIAREQAAVASAKLEREAEIAENKAREELKPATQVLQEAVDDVNGDLAVIPQAIKADDSKLTVPEKPVDPNKTTIQEEIKAADEGSPVVPNKPQEDAELAFETNGRILDKYEHLWNKPKYNNKNQKAAFTAPAKIQQAVEKTDWSAVVADLGQMAPGTKIKTAAGAVTSDAIIKRAIQSGNSDFLAELGLPAELLKKHTSGFERIRQPKPKTEARARTKAELQAEANKKAEANREKLKSGNSEDYFVKPLNTSTAEDQLDIDGLFARAEENPNEVLPVKVGPKEITLDQFVTMLESGKSTKVLDALFHKNGEYFSQFAEEGALKSADEVAVKAAPPVAKEADEILDEDEFDEILVQHMEEVDNPAAYRAEMAEKLGIAPEDAHLSAEELMGLTKKMENRDIRNFFKRKEGGFTAKEVEELRQFTGETDPEKMANEFIILRKSHEVMAKAKAKADAKKAVETVKPPEPKVSSVEPDGASIKPEKATPEDIQKIQQEAAQQAQEIANSPQALGDLFQREYRLNDYTQSLKKEFPEVAEVIQRDHINLAARDAVKAAISFQTKEGKFRTKTGYRTNTEGIDTGGAWRPDRWGTASEIALHSSIYKAVSELDFKGANLYKRNYLTRKAYMAIHEVADKELRAMGIEPYFNHINIGKKGFSVNLSYFDVLDTLDNAGFKTQLRKIITGHEKSGFLPTQIAGAVETVIRMRSIGKSEDEIRSVALKELTEATHTKGTPVDIAKKHEEWVKKGQEIRTRGEKGVSKAEAEAAHLKNAEEILDALMDPNTYRGLNTKMMINHAAHASQLGKHVDDLAKETVDRLMKLRDVSSGEVLGYLRAQVRTIAEKFSPKDLANAKALFQKRMDENMSQVEKLSAIKATNRAEEFKSPTPVVEKRVAEAAEIKPNGKPVTDDYGKQKPVIPPKQDQVNASHAETVKDAEAQAAKDAPEGTEDFEIVNAAIAAEAFRKIHPIQKYTNPRLGLNGDVYRQINSGLHSVARQQSEFHGSLLSHVAKYGDEALLNDFRELQRLAKESGHKADDAFVLPLDASESMRELWGITTLMFSKSNYNVFARNQVGAWHFNELAKAAGLNDKWRFKPENDAYTNSTLWMHWEGIEKNGVLDFLSKMHSISVRASQDIAIAASFTRHFGKDKYEPGLVKIVWNNKSQKDGTGFYNLIDKNKYYPKEIAYQVTQIDRLITESRHIDASTNVGKFIVNVFDPITNALKASQTTVRPGHWVISFVGDVLRNHLAGVNTYQPYKHAANIMLAGKKLATGEEDEFLKSIASAKELRKYKASQELNIGFTGESGGKGVHLYIGGKKVNVNYETMNKLVRDVVMLPKHRGGGVLEDRFVGENTSGSFARGLEKATDFVTDNKHFSLNEWAARRDNLMRVTLAVDFASKRKWKNLQEMKNAMEDYVTKWAPTSTDFTAWEAKYARRSMLYYTWLRGITPRVIDSAMTKPGVTTIVPKALYNTAYANGLNPESIGDPFPEDMMIPDYYRNGVLGPQWKDDYGTWGMNPSSPVIEVANTFSKFKLGDPLGNGEAALSQLGAMATPFARIPAEWATGTQAGTGIPIEDKNQYMLDNLGGSWISTLSRATGKTIGPDGIVDRTDGAAKFTDEDQLEHAKLMLLNFGLGGKLTDYQSNSALKAAAYDMAEEARRQSDLEVRRQ